MTDQAQELRPCPTCGGEFKPMDGGGLMHLCHQRFGEDIFINDVEDEEEWKTLFCWQELDRKDAEIAALRAKLKRAVEIGSKLLLMHPESIPETVDEAKELFLKELEEEKHGTR